jgi:hypothetical protein
VKRSNLTTPQKNRRENEHPGYEPCAHGKCAGNKNLPGGIASLLRAATPSELGALSLFALALSCGQFGLSMERRAGKDAEDTQPNI